MSESDEILVVTMAYCLTWEIGGARASQHWQGIRNFAMTCDALSETERWVCELYEESSPTAQEERSILSRIKARLDHPRVVVTFRQAILNLLPSSIAEAAAKHRLMNSLSVPEGYGRLRSWLSEHKIAGLRPAQPDLAPLAAREADFLRFIESPYFLEGFRKFWQQAPKSRTNQQMRILLCIAASLSQMLACDDSSEWQQWCSRLASIGCYTEQTQADVAELCLAMTSESYDAQELAYRLFADAQAVDRRNIITFCERYTEELGGFARDLVRGMQITV